MRKEEKTQLTRERILNAAMAEFGEKGYSGGSLNNICSTGIPKGLLYHNFENKDAIYLACIRQCFSAFTAFMRQQNPALNPDEYMKTRLHFFQENGSAARLFFEAILQPPLHLKEEIEEAKKDFDALNCEIYKNILSTVTLRSDVTEQEAMKYFSLMQYMFNGYFSSPAYTQMAFSDVMAAHEVNLSKLLDFMLYGIAERRKDQ
jgi:AcrR family transcriptional regulator